MNMIRYCLGSKMATCTLLLLTLPYTTLGANEPFSLSGFSRNAIKQVKKDRFIKASEEQGRKTGFTKCTGIITEVVDSKPVKKCQGNGKILYRGVVLPKCNACSDYLVSTTSKILDLSGRLPKNLVKELVDKLNDPEIMKKLQATLEYGRSTKEDSTLEKLVLSKTKLDKILAELEKRQKKVRMKHLQTKDVEKHIASFIDEMSSSLEDISRENKEHHHRQGGIKRSKEHIILELNDKMSWTKDSLAARIHRFLCYLGDYSNTADVVRMLSVQVTKGAISKDAAMHKREAARRFIVFWAKHFPKDFQDLKRLNLTAFETKDFHDTLNRTLGQEKDEEKHDEKQDDHGIELTTENLKKFGLRAHFNGNDKTMQAFNTDKSRWSGLEIKEIRKDGMVKLQDGKRTYTSHKRNLTTHMNIYDTPNRKTAIKTETIVNTLNRMVFDIIRQIKPRELINGNWEERDLAKRMKVSPNTLILRDIYQQISWWVTYQILDAENTVQGKTRIKKLVDIAQKLHESNNYFACYAFITGLNSSQVDSKRLPLLWEGLCFDNLEELRLMYLDNGPHKTNHKALRALITDGEEVGCLPYIGLLTAELAFTKLGLQQKDKTEEKTQVVCKTRTKTHVVIQCVARIQNASYKRYNTPETALERSLCQQLKSGFVLSQKRCSGKGKGMYDLSKKLQKRAKLLKPMAELDFNKRDLEDDVTTKTFTPSLLGLSGNAMAMKRRQTRRSPGRPLQAIPSAGSPVAGAVDEKAEQSDGDDFCDDEDLPALTYSDRNRTVRN